MRLQFSPQATNDLTAILDYVAQHNPRAALKLVEGLEATCANLAQSPVVGTIRSDLYPGLRVFSRGNYLIYFLPAAGNVLRIVRIMHGAREVTMDDLLPHI